jgi:hypothetical protein
MKTKSKLLKHSAKRRHENQRTIPKTLRQTAIWKPEANSLNAPPNRNMKTKGKLLEQSAKPLYENRKQNAQTLK